MLLRESTLAALAVVLLPWYAFGQEQERERERERVRTRTPAPRVWTIGGDDDERAVLGISTSSGGERDTLGLLITAITSGGPAEQAGLEEGNRIAAVNGVKLTLSSADAGEPDMSGILSRRFTRELRKVKPGDDVELRVYDDGQFRNVRVKTIAAADLPTRRRISSADLDDRSSDWAWEAAEANATRSASSSAASWSRVRPRRLASSRAIALRRSMASTFA